MNAQVSQANRATLVVAAAVAAVLLIALGLAALAMTRDSGGRAAGYLSGEIEEDPNGTSRTFPQVGVTLDPAPGDAQPKVSLEEAVAAAKADGIRPDAQEAVKPVGALSLLSKSMLGSEGNGTEGVRDQLVWDINYQDAPPAIRGPVDAPEMDVAPCDLHILVDANTGEVLEGFQVDCQVAKAQ